VITAARVSLIIFVIGSVPIHCDEVCRRKSRLLKRGAAVRAAVTIDIRLNAEVDIEVGAERRYESTNGMKKYCKQDDSDMKTPVEEAIQEAKTVARSGSTSWYAADDCV